MRKIFVILLLLLLNLNIVLADNINLEVHLTDDSKGDVRLDLDSMDIGNLPVIIKDIPVGEHRFTMKWIDDNGRSHSRSELINIRQVNRALYLSITKDRKSGYLPLFLGIVGGAVSVGIITYIIFQPR
ncbi:MAG: hypothetical protein ACUVWP_01395 [bacterium]